MSVSRRRLFGLFAGAAAAPLLPLAKAPSLCGVTASPEYVADVLNPQVLYLVQRRIAFAREAAVANLAQRLFHDDTCAPAFDWSHPQ